MAYVQRDATRGNALEPCNGDIDLILKDDALPQPDPRRTPCSRVDTDISHLARFLTVHIKYVKPSLYHHGLAVFRHPAFSTRIAGGLALDIPLDPSHCRQVNRIVDAVHVESFGSRRRYIVPFRTAERFGVVLDHPLKSIAVEVHGDVLAVGAAYIAQRNDALSSKQSALLDDKALDSFGSSIENQPADLAELPITPHDSGTNA